MVLERIRKANDIKKLNWDEMTVLAAEIRQFLVEHISKTGGHLASNLGAVELTMAIHLAMSFPKDKLIWDVGHQSYIHKILTGRKGGFDRLRCYQGMSGFPKRKESACDCFDTGHSSTSISAGLGFVKARDLANENYKVISVIGDGSLTGGMAYEALNNAANLKSNYIIILNDNNMSISENVGGMSRYLGELRTTHIYTELKKDVTNTLQKIPGVGNKVVSQIRKTKNSIKQLFVPGMLFEDMGLTYLGPVDGHDVKKIYRTLKEAQKMDHAVLIHVLTKKGKGYAPAENEPSKFHGVGSFNLSNGELSTKKNQDSYTDIFSQTICKLGEADQKIVTITAAMKDGTGLGAFEKLYPERFFDVGIAEQHAVTFAAGLAAAGLKPVFAVYSSFLQRAYDQVVHDVCLQNLPVVFAIDRAGLVGNDGETHQGMFDVSFLNHIPNMTILAPKNRWEMEDMLTFCFKQNGPVAIRYPRGNAYEGLKERRDEIVYGKSEMIYSESEVAIFSVGHMMEVSELVYKKLKEEGHSCSLVNARFIKPFDKSLIDEIVKNHCMIVTIEDACIIGGYGEQVESYIAERRYDCYVLKNGIGDHFVEHGDIPSLRKEIQLDADSITMKIKKILER